MSEKKKWFIGMRRFYQMMRKKRVVFAEKENKHRNLDYFFGLNGLALITKDQDSLTLSVLMTPYGVIGF